MFVGYYAGSNPVDMFAYDADGNCHNGSSFVAPADNAIASFRIAVTPNIDRNFFSDDVPSGTKQTQLRLRGSTFAESRVLWSQEIAESTNGDGPNLLTVTVKTASNVAIPGAKIRVSNNVGSYSNTSGNDGSASFSVPDGNYLIAIVADGFSFGPITDSVVADKTIAAIGTPTFIPSNPPPGFATVYGSVFNSRGKPEGGYSVGFKMVLPPTGAGIIWVHSVVSAIADSNGIFSIDLPAASDFNVVVGDHSFSFTTPASGSFQLARIIAL